MTIADKKVPPNTEHGKATPGPWRMAESVGGKVYIYGADNQPIIVPNVSATGRSKSEMLANYRLIVAAVNSYVEAFK